MNMWHDLQGKKRVRVFRTGQHAVSEVRMVRTRVVLSLPPVPLQGWR